MTIPFVKIEGSFNYDQARPGMAYFEGTGPAGKKCGDCKHRGYVQRFTKTKWNPTTGEDDERLYRTQGCALFKNMSGRHGPAVDKDWRACKFFDEKPKGHIRP